MSNDLIESKNLTTEQIDLIKTTICKNASDDELKLFLYTAKKTGLDPLAKQIYAVKRWDKSLGRETMTFQTGIDGYRLIASRTGQHLGTEDAVFVICKTTGKPLSGPHKASFSATARYNEYVQTTKEGHPTQFWKKMAYSQLAKCAEALALRKAFPQELSGMYTQEEMGQADNNSEIAEPRKYTVTKEPSKNEPMQLTIDGIPMTEEKHVFHDDPLPPLKEPEKPTTESLNTLMDMIAATETSSDTVGKWLDKAGVNDIDQLSQEQVDKCIALLRDKLAKQEK